MMNENPSFHNSNIPYFSKIELFWYNNPKGIKIFVTFVVITPLNFTELTFEFPVWRILADPSYDIIAFETRNHELRSVKFSAAEMNSGKKLWGEVETEEPWDTGLEEVCHEVVFIHGYLKQGTPEHKGILALDGKTGNLLWENKEWVLYRKTFHSLICFNALQEPRIYFYINPRTGEAYPETKSETEMINDVSVFTEQKNDEFQFPLMIQEDPENKDWKLWQDYIKSLLNKNALGCIEGIKISNYRVFSYYEARNGKLNNYVLICDLNGKLLLDELIAENVTSYGLDTFFIISGKICYVREKRFFKMIDL